MSRKASILLYESNQTILRMMKFNLEMEGFVVVEAALAHAVALHHRPGSTSLMAPLGRATRLRASVLSRIQSPPQAEQAEPHPALHGS